MELFTLGAVLFGGYVIWYSYRAYEEMTRAAKYWLYQWRTATGDEDYSFKEPDIAMARHRKASQ